METDTDIVAYAAGTVLFGYLLALPLWGIGALWNRQMRRYRVNPWVLPLFAFVVIFMAFANSHLTRPTPNDWVVAVGILPAALGCASQARNHRRK